MWVGALLPLAWLVVEGFRTGLGADPIETVTHTTGKSALVLLLVTLAVTPLRRATGWNPLVKVRRVLGLFAFFYACLHFLTYLFDQGFSPAFIVEDVVEHPYVTAGFTALVLLVPLAATSTTAAVRRLGRRWQTLHRLTYLAAGLGVLHFLWLVKKDLREPLIFAGVLLVLLVLRLPPLRPDRLRSALRARRETGPRPIP